MLFAALSALSLATVAAAQVTIQVGATASATGGVFQFIPPNVNAANGTVVTFQFSGVPGNHTVTQSSFASPCELVDGGFDSGWVLIPSAVSETPTWNLTITDDSKPLWFYCKQLKPSPHCVAGMVGAINAPTTGSNTFPAFQKAAESFSGNPGQSVGNLVGVGASASAPVGPIPSGVVTFGAPTPGAASATASSGSSTAGSSASSGSAATPSSTSAASHVAASSIAILFAAALGFVMV